MMFFLLRQSPCADDLDREARDVSWVTNTERKLRHEEVGQKHQSTLAGHGVVEVSGKSIPVSGVYSGRAAAKKMRGMEKCEHIPSRIFLDNSCDRVTCLL